jgi:hypothetical protein
MITSATGIASGGSTETTPIAITIGDSDPDHALRAPVYVIIDCPAPEQPEQLNTP